MDVLEELVRLRRAGQKSALATIVSVKGSIPSYESAKLLIRDDGSMVGTIGGGCVEAEVWAAAREVIESGKPRRMSFNLAGDALLDNGLICGGQLEVFIEPMLPVQSLYIFGAGHVSLSLSKIASFAGFRTVVVDSREQFANRARFPEAAEVHAAEYEDVMPKLDINESSYLAIVTRGHKDDMRVLRWAVSTPARYIGMIGSRRKAIEVFKELEREGVPADRLEQVHTPIGLEIGAVTPEEIAVSVVAELIAVRRGTELQQSNNRQAVTKSVFAN